MGKLFCDNQIISIIDITKTCNGFLLNVFVVCGNRQWFDIPYMYFRKQIFVRLF